MTSTGFVKRQTVGCGSKIHFFLHLSRASELRKKLTEIGLYCFKNNLSDLSIHLLILHYRIEEYHKQEKNK